MGARRTGIAPWLVTALSAVASFALVGAAALTDPGAADVSVPRADTTLPAPAPTSVDGEPGQTGPDADTATYDTRRLPRLDVWVVDGRLPVDDDPFGPMAGYVAQPHEGGAPVFAEPGAEPIAYLPRNQTYGGTSVPVVERHEHWLKVLLPGRQGVPPRGDAGQVVGWFRTADVEQRRNDAYVEVHLEARTIDIVTAAGLERVADDFSWGKPSTPTPTGRTFIMLTKVEPRFAYTKGHPLVYLGVQSPAMAGFDGGDVAVTAFHYYKVRSGPNSFGCIYLDGPATDRLAQLAEGTPVVIHP
ncbi:L,D-transpeptidase [Microbacterium sp. MC2]